MNKTLSIGTRGSPLALVQAQSVARAIEVANDGISVEVRIVKTKGDTVHDVSLETFGGEGVFVKELETITVALVPNLTLFTFISDK